MSVFIFLSSQGPNPFYMSDELQARMRKCTHLSSRSSQKDVGIASNARPLLPLPPREEGCCCVARFDSQTEAQGFA